MTMLEPKGSLTPPMSADPDLRLAAMARLCQVEPRTLTDWRRR
jgi:hypothetical protein